MSDLIEVEIDHVDRIVIYESLVEIYVFLNIEKGDDLLMRCRVPRGDKTMFHTEACAFIKDEIARQYKCPNDNVEIINSKRIPIVFINK